LPDVVTLGFKRADPALNDDVFSYEYSSTRIEKTASGGTNVIFEPMAHKRNIMRFYDSDFPEGKLTPSFQVSYPALQGASGAPVVAKNKHGFFVCGILVANIERELLPAQIVRIEDSERSFEETKYFLPHGKGLHSKVIIPFLEALKVTGILVDDEHT
jgi:hypothetical protein